MPERGSAEALFWKALLVVGGLWLIYLSLDVILLALCALIIAAAILPLADAAEKRRIPRSVTVLALYLIGTGVLTFLVTLLVPVVIEQAHVLVERLPRYRQTLNDWIVSGRGLLGRWGAGGNYWGGAIRQDDSCQSSLSSLPRQGYGADPRFGYRAQES